MDERQINLREALAYLGYAEPRQELTREGRPRVIGPWQQMMRDLRSKRRTLEEIWSLVDEGIEAGRIGCISVEVPESRIPDGDPVKAAMRASSDADRVVASRRKEMAEAGSLTRLDTLLALKQDEIEAAGVRPSAARWIALNLLCWEAGDVGEAARGMRRGWVMHLQSARKGGWT